MKKLMLLIISTSFSIAQVDPLEDFKTMEELANKIEEEVITVKDNYFLVKGNTSSTPPYSGNIGVFNSKEGLIVIDNQWRTTYKQVKKALREISKSKVKYILNTHYHFDHIEGNNVFSKDGIPIISHHNVREKLKEQVQLYDGFIQPAHNPNSLPNITFHKKMELNLEDETVEIFHFGPAHTGGDAIIKFKQGNVIHAGDVFVTYGFPFIDYSNGGSIYGFIHSLTQIIGIMDNETIVIPGHGPLCDINDVITLRDQINECYQRVKEGKSKGQSLDSIVKDIDVKLPGNRTLLEFCTDIYKNI